MTTAEMQLHCGRIGKPVSASELRAAEKQALIAMREARSLLATDEPVTLDQVKAALVPRPRRSDLNACHGSAVVIQHYG
jgi:hypothetical protein